MNDYRIDYVALHDKSGKPITKAPITIKTYVPVLNNALAYFLFMRKVSTDALTLNKRFNGPIPFDFYVSRAKHYGYLYVKVPVDISSKMVFYRDFITKML
ncbi:hypothetical protein P245_24760 [Comamonas thiooxydans]|uniref:Uncharacterized protein n=1 Tax=Comamonas thiooxydans TaxID=363952 RepID=A0A0E3B7P1_9BURK|nr:hypothetical protein [Comamonas thiooxydans]KGG83796.1 hypothetical protein P245_24760 [Comamonas thiooxydans]